MFNKYFIKIKKISGVNTRRLCLPIWTWMLWKKSTIFWMGHCNLISGLIRSTRIIWLNYGLSWIGYNKGLVLVVVEVLGLWASTFSWPSKKKKHKQIKEELMSLMSEIAKKMKCNFRKKTLKLCIEYMWCEIEFWLIRDAWKFSKKSHVK